MRFSSGLIAGALIVLIPTSLALIVSLSRPGLQEPVTPGPALLAPPVDALSTQPTSSSLSPAPDF
jgi:hypothetical protein